MTRPLIEYPLYYAAHLAMHKLWSAAVGTPGYDKKDWLALDAALLDLGRAAQTGSKEQ